MNFKTHKAIIAKRDIREIAYEIQYCYDHGYNNSSFKHMVDSMFNWYDRNESWTPKQEEFLRNHLAYIKTEKEYVGKIESN